MKGKAGTQARVSHADAQVLVAKGVPLGTAIAFMMAVVGLSLPEAMLLKKVMQWRLPALFFGTVTLLIILSSHLFLLLM